MSVVCATLESVVLIEASLEELPVSAILGQSCLATKIRAPRPSLIWWFRHTIPISTNFGQLSRFIPIALPFCQYARITGAPTLTNH